MGKKPEFMWDEETGMCSCAIVLDDFIQGYGIAECHPQDIDVKSQRTGEHIAELRATINLLQNYKNRELHPGLKALKHVKGTMINSKHHNPDNYESKRLNVEIKNYQKDINDINEMINAYKQELYGYINKKEVMYQRQRAKDTAGFKDEDTEMLMKDIEIYRTLYDAEPLT